MKQEKAVILLSGGLDSATVLAQARADGFEAHALSFQYGQRHDAELRASERVAAALGAASHRLVRLDIGSLGGSALTDASLRVPEEAGEGIPVTYVPARNTVFLSVAMGWAEIMDARAIYIGVNAVDYSGYPDCRPAFIERFQALARVATRQGLEGRAPEIRTPLIDLPKAEIIRRGLALGVDYGLTVSCYQADQEGRACGRCDACRFRRQGFEQAGVEDPTVYQA
ncbi:7-cyano-7-deazaguanine synthase QueC [Natronospira bacteriovora]|uniref:7-cyano-7-deazaguanine synthase n=1 Tax=Natronospira bacteriovora TaxID=3069753 RepID=A0ABU0W418_9GAMM|nr:7-cyano-7-deazaguanine synthase QueC [Natronospira sp. AB-CW4]MDQ2068503.1 7-cyano-7-deazaguanine synthase QueC [Natronospira sp. AB-CW4]